MAELQHPDARSFEEVAELYERVRPTYPDEAVTWLADQLAVGPDSTVLDLGAGTGKLTRAFVGLAGRVVAVEPGPEMLAQLRRVVPGAEALLGAAEAIPLEDDTVDAVVCGQSFHWFRRDEAMREMRRVLRPGGGLGLIWNTRDNEDPVQAEVTNLLAPFVPPGREALPTSARRFAAANVPDLITAEFRFEQELDSDALAGRLLSISFVAAAPGEQQRELEQQLRTLVAAHGGRVPFRYRTEAYVTRNVV